MKLFKRLGRDLGSPYQDFQYEIGKEVIVSNFDSSDNDYSFCTKL